MDGKTILLIEPNARLRSGMEASLRQMGYAVVTAACETGTTAAGRDAPADLALLACESPSTGGDSFDYCRKLVQNKLIAAGVMSALQPTRELVRKAIRAGALEFLVKPASAELLAHKLDTAYRRARHQGAPEPEFQQLDFGPGTRPPDERVDIIVRQAATLRAMPQAVAKVLQIVSTDKSAAQDLAKAVESDPSIASMVLKHARTPLYAARQPIRDLKQAVIRLGFKHCRQLVLGLAVVKLFSREGKCFGLNRTWFWLHSLACGILAQQISAQAGIAGDEEPFVAGLLHDIGKLLLDDFLSDEYQLTVQKANVDRITLYDAEMATLNRNHATVGAEIAAHWGLHDDLLRAILHHHDHELIHDARPQSPTLQGAVYLANQMSKAMLVGSGGDLMVQAAAPSVWRAYGFKELPDREFRAAFVDEIKAFGAFLGLDENEIDLPAAAPLQTGPAVIVDPGANRTFLTSLLLAGLGYATVTRESAAETPGASARPSVCVIYTRSMQEVKAALATLGARAWDSVPSVCLLPDGISPEQVPAPGPRFRILAGKTDCFELSCAVKEVVGPGSTTSASASSPP